MYLINKAIFNLIFDDLKLDYAFIPIKFKIF